MVWENLRRLLKASRETFVDQVFDFNACQRRTLLDICSLNRHCVTGKLWHFADVTSVKDFQSHCPVNTYESLAPEILTNATEFMSPLFSEPVLAFEVTGGSQSGGRLIPYNESLLKDFRLALFAWFADVIEAYDLREGTIFWPISPPAAGKRNEHDGLPVGMGSDAAYFGEEVASLFGQILAVPFELSTKNMAEWQMEMCKALMKAEDLALVSVWSPTFFTELLKYIKEHRWALLSSLESEISPEHAARLRDACSSLEPEWWKIWPKLRLISSWCDGPAATFALELQRSFPYVAFQGKGLLATEAVISVPLAAARDPVLVPTSCFYEFRSEDQEILTAEDVIVGASYDLLITTRGGLYRYDIGDRILVTGYFGTAPMVRFLGRVGTSDLCGEKLSEYFVGACLAKLPGYAVLAARQEPEDIGYELIADASWCHDILDEKLISDLEQSLRKNPQYDLARMLGQLKPLTVRKIPNLISSFQKSQVEHGRRLGDIKPPVLVQDRDWLASLHNLPVGSIHESL